MPRKATKADKPALQFLERPVGGTRLQHAPEVRAAVNPKEFFSETQPHNSSDLNAWVSCSLIETMKIIKRCTYCGEQ